MARRIVCRAFFISSYHSIVFHSICNDSILFGCLVISTKKRENELKIYIKYVERNKNKMKRIVYVTLLIASFVLGVLIAMKSARAIIPENYSPGDEYEIAYGELIQVYR